MADGLPRIIHEDTERSYQVLLDLSVELNLRFKQWSASGQMVYRDHHPKHETTYAIERVRHDKHLKKKVLRIAERFPHRHDIHGQAAYLLRAFSGLQLFPDANHRTGLAIMREHLHMNGQHFHLAGPPLADFIHMIRDRRSRYCTRCTADKIDAEDAAFGYIRATVTAHCRPLTIGESIAVLYPNIAERFPWFESPPLFTGYAPERAEEERLRKG